MFGKKQVNMFEMTGILGPHLTVPEAARDAGESLEAVAPARGGGLRLVGGTEATGVPQSSAPATPEVEPGIDGRMANLSREHREALEWFAARTGKEIPWPEPLNGTHVVNRAKGIHKPAGFRHALSIRQSLAGPYEDAVEHSAGRGWILKYAQEGDNPNYFTNEALNANLADGVPVAVLLQVRPKPDPRYRVLGLGRVVDWRDGVFEIHEWGANSPAGDDLDVEVPAEDFKASDAADAREKMLLSAAGINRPVGVGIYRPVWRLP